MIEIKQRGLSLLAVFTALLLPAFGSVGQVHSNRVFALFDGGAYTMDE